MKKLTKSQQKIYDYLVSIKDDGISPTVREICEATGFKSTSTVHSHLNTLEKLGYITKRSDSVRGIFVNNLDGTPESVAVPIIDTVTEGKQIFAFKENLGYVTVDESVKRGRDIFALRIKGDSMINAGIFEGDTVVFVRQSAAENGEIIAALLENEIIVKRFYKEDGNIKLQSENSSYEPIISKKVKILGKVVTLVRNYE